MKSNHGFTTLNIMLTVGIAGILGVSGIVTYNSILPKVQATEATKLLNAEKVNLINNIKQGKCFDNQSGVVGRNGGVHFSGELIRVNGSECPIGCRLNYTFNNTVSSQLRGKVLSVLVLKNNTYSVDTRYTTLDNKFISSSFKSYVSNQCPELPGLDINEINEGSGANGISVGNQPNGSPGTIPDGVGDETEDTPINDFTPPSPPPLTNAQKETIANSIASRLSEFNHAVVIEPQGFDYTVTATPRAANNALNRCSDTLDVKANETVVRYTPGFVSNSETKDGKYYYHTGTLTAQMISSLIGITTPEGKPTPINRPIKIYVPCSYFHVGPNSIDAAFEFKDYQFSSSAFIQLNVFGVVQGRGGSAGDIQLKTERVTTGIDYFNSRVDHYPDESVPNYPIHMKPLPYELSGKMVFAGGPALINHNVRYPIDVVLHGEGRIDRGGNATGLSALQKWSYCRTSLIHGIQCTNDNWAGDMINNLQTLWEPQKESPILYMPIQGVGGGFPLGEGTKYRTWGSNPVRGDKILNKNAVVVFVFTLPRAIRVGNTGHGTHWTSEDLQSTKMTEGKDASLTKNGNNGATARLYLNTNALNEINSPTPSLKKYSFQITANKLDDTEIPPFDRVLSKTYGYFNIRQGNQPVSITDNYNASLSQRDDDINYAISYQYGQ